MGLEGLLEIQRRKRWYIEACEPHGTHNHHAKRMIFALEGGFNIQPLPVFQQEAVLDEFAMRPDIKIPFPEPCPGAKILCYR